MYFLVLRDSGGSETAFPTVATWKLGCRYERGLHVIHDDELSDSITLTNRERLVLICVEKQHLYFTPIPCVNRSG